MSSHHTPSPSNSKRQRKANYAENEIRVLLEEVMLARTVLFSAFTNKVTLQAKNKGWEEVAAAVTACGVARRSRVEVKEKWKAMKADALGRQRSSSQTGGGPPDTPIPYEDTILQILGAESNLVKGVTTTYPLSYLGRVAAPVSAAAGTAPVGPEVHLRCSDTLDLSAQPHDPPYNYPEASTSFSAPTLPRPVLSSTPLVCSAREAAAGSVDGGVPFTMAGEASVTLLTGGPGSLVTLTAQTEDAARPPYTGTSTRSRSDRGRSRSRQRDFLAEGPERQAFLTYLESTTQKNVAETTVLNARVEHEAAEGERAQERAILETEALVLKNRRERLQIQRLEREADEESVWVNRELVKMRLRRETLEVAKLEREMGGRV